MAHSFAQGFLPRERAILRRCPSRRRISSASRNRLVPAAALWIPAAWSGLKNCPRRKFRYCNLDRRPRKETAQVGIKRFFGAYEKWLIWPLLRRIFRFSADERHGAAGAVSAADALRHFYSALPAGCCAVL
jgi:hypothetical protein